MQISLCPGQKCNQTACRRKLNKHCVFFYYLVSKFPESPGLVGTQSVASGIPVVLTATVLGPGSILKLQEGLSSLHLCLHQKALNMHLIKIVVRNMKRLWGKLLEMIAICTCFPSEMALGLKFSQESWLEKGRLSKGDWLSTVLGRGRPEVMVSHQR